MSETVFETKDFRRALSQFPTGVTVITTVDKSGNPIGVTASSFNSVSIDPALVLWSIDKGANSLAAFESAEHFVVNVLGRDQVNTSNNFASRGEDKFKDADYHAGVGGCPVLNDYAAQFECNTWATYEGGDHLILVGEVVQYRYRDGTEPLVFSRGSYAVSNQHPNIVSSKAATKPDTGSDFVSDYLLYLLREAYQSFGSNLYPKLQQECGVTAEEWRILACMINRPVIEIGELTGIVMQPEVGLRQTADWLIGKGHLEYQDTDTLRITEEGAAVARKMQQIAIAEEVDLLALLSKESSQEIKSSLRIIINKLTS